ncbi:hypothetical protein GGR57DRAFT_175866 [Xylariaceae sp. FL1272]|nr:hypothetical protein GGR57DRAFT_175866 [Xylariaceae sp. FL1272]
MHPAPSLSESFPKSTKPDDRPQHVSFQQLDQNSQQPRLAPAAQLGPPEAMKGDNHLDHSVSQSSPPMRKDTGSSTSTNVSDATAVTTTSTDTAATAYSVESSQSIFSVKDGSEISSNRRASRRRTGPLSAAQREKAALIRKLGACPDCRRRRVACHPNHHNMTWEEAVQKYRSSSPVQELAALAGRPLSPAPSQIRLPPLPRPQEMDIDSSSAAAQQHVAPVRTPINDTRINRTPLPSGPRLDRHMSMPPPLAAAPPPPPYTTIPHLGYVKPHLDNAATRILSSPQRTRYRNAHALLIHWQDESDAGTVEELAEVFRKAYDYEPEIIRIPSIGSDSYSNPGRWLSKVLSDFFEKSDTRETLKILYYNGFSFLDSNKEMVLSSSRNREKAGTIRWSTVQPFLEDASSDTLVLMDSAYFPTSRMVRRKGVLEVIAASASENYFNYLERGIFTKILIDQLRTRPLQRSSATLSAVELHSKLLSIFPKLIVERHLEKGTFPEFPTPLHTQTSGNTRLPSITLSPQLATLSKPLSNPEGVVSLTISIRLTDESLSRENWADNWTEWFRMMPEGIRDAKVEGPFNTFR